MKILKLPTLLLLLTLSSACSWHIGKPVAKVTAKNYPARVTNTYQKYATKDYNGAIQEASNVIEFRPDSAEAYYNRALSKMKVNDKGGCLSDLKKARDLYEEQGNQIGKAMVAQTIDAVKEAHGKIL